jgi:hypothetical protein
VTTTDIRRVRAVGRRWPLLLLAAPAAVSIWAGWVGLGTMAGFGLVHPLPGIADGFELNSAITLPIGVEAYSAYALGTWLTSRPMPRTARLFAAWSSGVALLLGLIGQVVYHVLTTTGHQTAPTPVVVFVACLPVLVLGAGATLHHLLGDPVDQDAPATEVTAQLAATGTALVPGPAGESAQPEKPRRPARRKTGKSRPAAAPRRLEADYLAQARAALVEGVEPTAVWCQQVTGCGKTLSFALAKTLRTERAQTGGQVSEMPTHTTTEDNQQEEAA